MGRYIKYNIVVIGPSSGAELSAKRFAGDRDIIVAIIAADTTADTATAAVTEGGLLSNSTGLF